MLSSSLTGSKPILVVAAMDYIRCPFDVPIREPRQGYFLPINASTDYPYVPTMNPALQILLRFATEESRGRYDQSRWLRV